MHLAIDQGIQRVAERELDAAFRTYETKGASLVVMDPNDGNILAVANVIDSAISVLRKHLARKGRPPLIHTRYGHGYVLKASDS